MSTPVPALLPHGRVTDVLETRRLMIYGLGHKEILSISSLTLLHQNLHCLEDKLN